MQKPKISLIAALGLRTLAIGKNGALLWHLPDDLKRFKQLTVGHPIIMGSKTYESIGRPLPNRVNIVVSDKPMPAQPDVHVVYSIDAAINEAGKQNTGEVFVIGGGQIYKQTIGLADRLYLTIVDDDAMGDTFFPDYRHLPFVETSREKREHNGIAYSFVELERNV